MEKQLNPNESTPSEARSRCGAFAELDRDLAEGLDRLLTYREVSAMVGIPLGTLYAEVHKHRLPHVRLGPRTVRFRLSDVQGWVANAYRPVAHRTAAQAEDAAK